MVSDDLYLKQAMFLGKISNGYIQSLDSENSKNWETLKRRTRYVTWSFIPYHRVTPTRKQNIKRRRNEEKDKTMKK